MKFEKILSSMLGTKKIQFDNEEEVAYYYFFNLSYKSNPFTTVCSSETLKDENNKILTGQDVDKLIEKYFPEETKQINIRKEKEKNILFKLLINKDIIGNHLVLNKKIIDNISSDKKEKYQNIIKKQKI